MDITTAIILLTILVGLLSLIIIVLLVVAIVLIIKINKVVGNIRQITTNAMKITDWFSPFKVFREAVKAINSIRK